MSETSISATEVPAAPGASGQSAPVAATTETTIPQVGDVTPQGVIAGVRRFAGGGCEISFNGADWQAA